MYASLVGPGGRRLRLGQLTTIDMSLALLLETELRADVAAGLDVFGISAPGGYVDQVEALGIRHVAIPELTRAWQPARDLRAARALARRLRALRLDVLHTHTPKAGVLGRILGRVVGVPVVVNTCHGLWARPEDAPSRRALVYGAEAVAIRFSDAELFQNAEDARTLRRGLAGRSFCVVGNGIDLSRFRFDPSGRARVRAELGVDDATLVVGGVGRRVAEKGLREFAVAARALSDRAIFLWVGPEDPDKADAMTTDLDGLRWIPARTDMPALYSALDLFVLPSYREGFSRSAMEAAACGRAMVLSDIRGCREIGTAGEHLLLVPPRDGRALTDAVSRLLADGELRTRLGTAARDRAHQEFDQEMIARMSLQTYANIAARKGLPWTVDLP